MPRSDLADVCAELAPQLRAGLVTMSRQEFADHCRAAQDDAMVPAWRVRQLIREIEGQSLSRYAIIEDAIARAKRG